MVHEWVASTTVSRAISGRLSNGLIPQYGAIQMFDYYYTTTYSMSDA